MIISQVLPKAASHLLTWSAAQQIYMLLTLSERAHHEMLDIAPECRAWLDGAFSFVSA